MATELTEKDVLDMVRKQWERKMARLEKDYGMYMGNDDDEDDGKKSDMNKKEADKNKIKIDTSIKGLLTRDVRLRHKDSSLEYTVVSASPRDVILRTPEGRAFTVSADEINKDYSLD